MASQPQTGLTYEDLRAFPQDNLRREIIDGELFVTAAPATRHQRAVTVLVGSLFAHCKVHGGQVYPAPTDVYFSETERGGARRDLPVLPEPGEGRGAVRPLGA
jgi:hypothetical protein